MISTFLEIHFRCLREAPRVSTLAGRNARIAAVVVDGRCSVSLCYSPRLLHLFRVQGQCGTFLAVAVGTMERSIRAQTAVNAVQT